MTIKDLANQTGYSIGTVSRVLNNQPHVSDLAREVILKAAKESGFQLNSNAKQLKQQHGNTILVICKGTHNELFDTLLVSIQARISGAQNPPLIVDYIDESDNEVRRGVQLAKEKKPLGILFLGGNRENFLADFHQIDVPCVLVTSDASGLPFSNLSSVTADDTLAARMAVSRLAEAGHKKIAVIGGNRSYSEITRLRYQGCLEAFREHGLAFSEESYETARFTYEDGYRAARVLLTREPGLTAVFAMSDVMAIGAVRYLKDAGIRVPEEVSVMGFDGLEIGDYMIPRMTTIAQNVSELARQSLELLQRQIESGAGASYETVPVQLLWKESTIEI